MNDFEKALEEVKPAFGAATDSLKSYCMHGIVNCGETFDHLQQALRTLVNQASPRVREKTAES
jgi:vesicle-fusing ATPase